MVVEFSHIIVHIVALQSRYTDTRSNTMFETSVVQTPVRIVLEFNILFNTLLAILDPSVRTNQSSLGRHPNHWTKTLVLKLKTEEDAVKL